MSEEMRDDNSTEIDPLADIQIDERFKAAGPDDETVSSDSSGSESPHISATVSTPRHLTPDSFAAKTEDAEDPLVGQMIGNYEVVSQLGKGGFGTV